VPRLYTYVVFQGVLQCGFLGGLFFLVMGFGYPWFRYPTVAPEPLSVDTLAEAQRVMNWSCSVIALSVGACERTRRL
jgi:hypothetical protein